MEEILSVENIKKEYGRKGSKHEALRGITFKVYKGEFVGIMGSSGAGKSTLLNIISTIDLPSSGDIYINGKNTIKMKQNELADFRRDNLGFVFQDSNLLDTLTIKENIMLPLSLKNERVSVIENRIKEISKEDAPKMIQKYHYSNTLPKINKYFLGVFLEKELVGVATLGWGTRPRHTIQRIKRLSGDWTNVYDGRDATKQ